MQKPILYIVIPCYNEQEVLPVTSGMFLKKIQDLTDRFVKEIDKMSEKKQKEVMSI